MESAKADYEVFDLTKQTPLLTGKDKDESRKKWDKDDSTGLRFDKAIRNVEYFRDIQPILKKSCVACHSSKDGRTPAAKLDLDADHESVQIENQGKFPGTYTRLALDERARFGHKPIGYDSWGYPNASRYIRMFQSRRSLLVWKIFGERLDGFSNDDHPSETKPGAHTLAWKGKPVEVQKYRHRWDLDYLPPQMPDPRSPQFTTAAAEEIVKILELTDGRAFVLFTSLYQMHEVYELVKNRIPFPTLLQGQGSKAGILERFRSTPGAVLFAVSSFWQGVDVQGEALSCVIIDKLPFSVPTDPVVAARHNYIDAHGGNSFIDYSVPQAIITFSALTRTLGPLLLVTSTVCGSTNCASPSSIITLLRRN